MMDSIERVRDFARGAEPLSAESVDVARQRLLKQIAAEERRVRTPRRWALPSLLMGAAAVAVVTAVAVLVPMRAPSAAAEVLRGAASLSASAVDIEVPEGQFLEVETTGTLLVLWDADMRAQWARFNNGDPRAAEAGLDVRSTSTLYVPSDRDDDWILVSAAPEVTASYGDRADEARGDWARQRGSSENETAVFPGGVSTTPDGGAPSYFDGRNVYDEMPRDPEALLEWWRERSGLSGSEADRWAVSGIADDLSVNLMPAELRAAMFGALALLGSAEVSDVDGELTTLSFAWELGGRNIETRLTIDTDRGLVTGTMELEHVDGTIFPSPVVLQETTVSTSIVDTVFSQ